MAISSFTNPRFRTAFLVLASLLVIAGAAIGTVLLIKQFAPSRDGEPSKEVVTDNRSPLKKAEDLFAKGDYAAAKTQYQIILDDYKSQNNEAGVKDIEMQLKVLEATAAAPTTPQNTDRNRVVAGSKSE